MAGKAAENRRLNHLQRRRRRCEEIRDGSLPSTEERLCGYPPVEDNEETDRRLFFRSQLIESGTRLDEDQIAKLELAASDPSVIRPSLRSG